MRYPQIEAVDLFCGVGGLTHGLKKAGIDVRLGVDVDKACEYPFTVNNKCRILLKPVEHLQTTDFKGVYSESSIKLLAGCAPCQTFSSYNRKSGESDSRWWLLRQFSRLVGKLSPDLVTMENVPRLVEQSVFRQFVSSLTRAGYEIDYRVVSCSDYGIPQIRKRLVLIASRLGMISIVSPSQFGQKRKTVKQAIGKLPAIEAGKGHPSDPLHQSAILSDVNLKRIKASLPGGTWRDWPPELVAECHQKATGKTFPSVYGRMCWNEPSPTVTTQFFGYGNGRFGHPEQNRAISLREGAILQSFPKNYKFVAPGMPVERKTLGRLIGNAVPVKLGQMIGYSMLSYLKGLSS